MSQALGLFVVRSPGDNVQRFWFSEHYGELGVIYS